MTQFVSPNTPAGGYSTVAASQTTQTLGAVGATGDYLQGITIIPGSATIGSVGAVTVKDGTTTVITIPASVTIVPFYIPLGAYSKTGAWNITTGAAVSVFAVGQFT